ncbi:MAG: hypothetical protein J3Q66DRAFT_342919 [Benniella sp.]|nr:MAG: hypothetical protein J3Q66DRAFT_342919 [Benniella sp.]
MTYPSAPSNERPARSQTATAARSRHRSNIPASRVRSSSVNSERSHRRSKHPSSSSSSSSSSTSPSSPSDTRTSIQRHGPSAKTTPMHDDSDAGRLIPIDRPAFAIDYLGSNWNNEDDIAASWKFMTKQKNDLINGLRLENASWRNWAKQRHNLKTVNPRTLNWLKDSDTTWLYGPLYKASIDEFDLARFGTQTIPAGAKIPTSPSDSPGCNGLKPVLKHKTASELFKADTLFHVQSDLKLDRKIEPKCKAEESLVIKQHRQPKLRFNDSVEQCVSIDTDALSEDEVIDEDEEDAGILMRISSRHSNRSIVRIHPTRLKAENLVGMESDDVAGVVAAAPDSQGGRSNTNNNTTSRGRSYWQAGVDDDDDEDAHIASVAFSHSRWDAGADSEKTQDIKGGFGQRAADLVNNVRDIVHWASSFVYNSSTF